MLIQIGRRWLNTDRMIGAEQIGAEEIRVYLDRGMEWTFAGHEARLLLARLSSLDGPTDPVTEPEDVTEEMPPVEDDEEGGSKGLRRKGA